MTVALPFRKLTLILRFASADTPSGYNSRAAKVSCEVDNGRVPGGGAVASGMCCAG